MSESELLNEMHERVVKGFLDMLILMSLRRNAMSGYDFVKFISDRFHLLISSGTIYSTLYYLERKGLIEGSDGQRKRVYNLTNGGKEKVNMFLESKDKFLDLILDLFICA